ncbi:MAG TPA: hypothetical protein ENK14_01050 [Caldithrix sp.]|nr:hypothetical protein [Caldithrix sp.]
MSRGSSKYFLLLLSMTLLFGLSFIDSKNAPNRLGIFQFIFGRCVFTLLVLTVVLGKQRRNFYVAVDSYFVPIRKYTKPADSKPLPRGYPSLTAQE